MENNNNTKKKVIEHEVLIKRMSQDVKDIKNSLQNHITDVYKKFAADRKEIYEKFDKYKTLFISILVTLVLTLVGVVISIAMQFIETLN